MNVESRSDLKAGCALRAASSACGRSFSRRFALVVELRGRCRCARYSSMAAKWLPGLKGHASYRELMSERLIFARLAVLRFARLAEGVEAGEISCNEGLFLRPGPSLELGFAEASLGKR